MTKSSDEGTTGFSEQTYNQCIKFEDYSYNLCTNSTDIEGNPIKWCTQTNDVEKVCSGKFWVREAENNLIQDCVSFDQDRYYLLSRE